MVLKQVSNTLFVSELIRMNKMKKVPITNGISLLPPLRTGSDNFAGRTYLILFGRAENKAHREKKKSMGISKSFAYMDK